jgi:hypothetical protein
MPNYLTECELRQAAVALNIIEEKGDPDEFEYILAHSRRAQRGALGNPESIGFNLNSRLLADRLAGILGESRERCEKAVQLAFGGGDWRARGARDKFRAILAYAAELTPKRREPQSDLLDQFNRYGLGAMLDYSCVRGADDTPTAEPTRRPATEAPADKVRFVRKGATG